MYTYIPISPPSCVSLPPSLSHPSKWSQGTELISLCYVVLLPTICFTFGSVYMSMPLSHFIPAYPSPFPCPQVHSLCLCLYSWTMTFFKNVGHLFCRMLFNLGLLSEVSSGLDSGYTRLAEVMLCPFQYLTSGGI